MAEGAEAKNSWNDDMTLHKMSVKKLVEEVLARGRLIEIISGRVDISVKVLRKNINDQLDVVVSITSELNRRLRETRKK
jgi:hypothetical protein